LKGLNEAGFNFKSEEEAREYIRKSILGVSNEQLVKVRKFRYLKRQSAKLNH